MKQEILNMITNKKDKRLAILLLSAQEESTFTSEDLEQLLKVTKVTLKRDLQELKELFPTQLTIEISKSITILVNENYTIFELLKLLLIKDPTLIIFFELIPTESLNFFECCKKLYISDTTLKRYIMLINRYLAKYEIKLSYFPIRFIGSENNIRAFYVKFLETFDYLEIDLQKKLITSFCKEFKEKLAKTPMKNLEINFKKLNLWLSTITLRTKMQHFIKLPDIDLSIIEKTNLHKMFKQHLKNSYFLQNIPESEKKFIYLILWDCIENDFSFLFLKQSSNLIQNLKISDTCIHSLQESIEQLFYLNENKSSKTDILCAVLCSFFVLKKLSQLLPNYYMIHPEIKNYLLYYHHDLYKKWQQFINKFPLLFDNSVDTQILGLQFTLLSLINYWFKLQTYKIAIDLNVPSSCRWLILSVFKEKLAASGIEIQSVPLIPYKTTSLLQSFDFLITNYWLELPPNAPLHFQLCKYPTIREIEKTIRKIIQLKENSICT